MIVQLKKDRHTRKSSLDEKKELYDNFYAMAKKHFLSLYLLAEEKSDIEDAATQQLLERGRQEWEKTMQ